MAVVGHSGGLKTTRVLETATKEGRQEDESGSAPVALSLAAAAPGRAGKREIPVSETARSLRILEGRNTKST